MILKTFYIGDYEKFYENGQIEVSGKFFDSYENGINKYVGNIRDGEWKWYLENGELDAEAKYKVGIEYWANGNVKSIYGMIFDNDENIWMKHGRFYSFSENGDEVGDLTEYEWNKLKEVD